MYTADEIKSKVPQLKPKDGDQRLELIKGIFFVLWDSGVETIFRIIVYLVYYLFAISNMSLSHMLEHRFAIIFRMNDFQK